VNVPDPKNPKKRSLMPSSPLRRQLRGAGHHLSPIVQVGKEGVTEAVLRQLDRALLDHELVKVKAGSETPEDRFETADALLAGAEGAQLAQILGRTLLLYRRHPKKPRYEPLPAPPRAAPPTRAERQAKAAELARANRPARSTRAERMSRSARISGTERSDRSPRAERTTRNDRVSRTSRTERGTRGDRSPRTERTTRPGRPPRR
jgi:RNA-binding protein